jgi:hypothetical protein
LREGRDDGRDNLERTPGGGKKTQHLKKLPCTHQHLPILSLALNVSLVSTSVRSGDSERALSIILQLSLVPLLFLKNEPVFSSSEKEKKKRNPRISDACSEKVLIPLFSAEREPSFKVFSSLFSLSFAPASSPCAPPSSWQPPRERSRRREGGPARRRRPIRQQQRCPLLHRLRRLLPPRPSPPCDTSTSTAATSASAW